MFSFQTVWSQTFMKSRCWMNSIYQKYRSDEIVFHVSFFISIFQYSVESSKNNKAPLKKLLFCSWLVAENSIDMNRICKNDDLEFKLENILGEGKYVFQFPINTYISSQICVFFATS